MGKVRLSIEISEELSHFLDQLSEEESVTRTEIVRRAFAMLKAYREQIAVGRTHVGFTKDADKLDLELGGILTTPMNKNSAKKASAEAIEAAVDRRAN